MKRKNYIQTKGALTFMTKDFDYEQMLDGDLYVARNILPENQSIHGQRLAQTINQLPIDETDKIIKLEKELFGSTGEHIFVAPPLRVDYGRHVHLGENVYCNMDCLFLDVNTITIGNNVMLGPRVSLLTAGHPIDADIRISDLEFGLPITIEDNVWIGGSATILPGITVGKNSIVAAGAIVTRDVPENVIVGGNPAKIIRNVTEEDTQKWQQKSKAYYQKKTNHSQSL